jgi:hypothetical protein
VFLYNLRERMKNHVENELSHHLFPQKLNLNTGNPYTVRMDFVKRQLASSIESAGRHGYVRDVVGNAFLWKKGLVLAVKS